MNPSSTLPGNSDVTGCPHPALLLIGSFFWKPLYASDGRSFTLPSRKVIDFIAPVSFPRSITRWLPAIAWMLIIFAGSSDLGATKHTSRIIGPLLRWFNPNVTDETIRSIQYGIRKTAHAVEYAILSTLIWRGLRKQDEKDWNRKKARVAVILSALYAMTDELHQTLVSSRQGAVGDVLLDTFGAAVGIVFLWFFGRFRKWW